ncbi:MAG: DUF2905 domain-containing protein [Candidatus Auribacter fodinae]|jgi:predicted membrane protein|uniref:DUF2905 domain-containing protein n=1 Tax=Candidatus Auribacter fodinae TaxID=2093366 RepID=A0A3A4QX14_9BACT|nr:MAG: DUF2905 domain-containing protein [Candidatus Auribacter fodinae]
MQAQFAKIFLIAGIILLAVGLYFLAGGKIEFLGRLPGDIHIEKENFKLYIPIMSGLVISVLVTLIMWIIRLFR